MPRRNQQSMMRQSRRRAARRQNEPPVDPEPSWYAGPMLYSRPVSEPVSHFDIEDDVTTILPPISWAYVEYQAPMEILDHIERARRAEEMRNRSYINVTALPRRSGIQRMESKPRMHEECKEEEHHCVVCLMNIQIGEQMTRLTRCVHVFHSRCVDPWLDSRHTCPTCRSYEDIWCYDWKRTTPPRGTPVIIEEAAYDSEERTRLMRRLYGEDPAHRVSREDAAIEDVFTLFTR
jgi:hypothetical protein